jgi:hypothetical protein
MNVATTVTLFCSSLILAACENTTLIGHTHAINLAVEVKADASEPVIINFVYSSHSIVVVPPRVPLSTAQRADINEVPEGDLLSTLSYFKIEQTQQSTTTGSSNPSAVQFTIRTGVATGIAATELASPTPSPSRTTPEVTAATARDATGIGEKMNAILMGK